MAGHRGRILIGGALVVLVLGVPAAWRMRARRPGTASVESDAGSVEVRPAPPDPRPDGSAIARGDAAAWRKAPMAFGPRELGTMGPYVKAGLDAARREMEFCFQQEGAPSDGGADPGPHKSAVLLLHLEAREGALDVVDAWPESMGNATPRLVDCCRDVLRGYEIRAFNPVPGRRYRFRFVLE